MTKEIKKTTTKVKTPVVKKAVVRKDTKKVETKAVSPIIETPKAKVSKTNVARYLNKNLMISPRKLRLLADNIRKMSPTEALSRLTNTKAARIMIKALQNIIADAKNNFNLDENSLKFDLIKVDEGLKIKRMDKAHGSRFARGLVQKRHSRLIIQVKGIQK